MAEIICVEPRYILPPGSIEARIASRSKATIAIVANNSNSRIAKRMHNADTVIRRAVIYNNQLKITRRLL